MPETDLATFLDTFDPDPNTRGKKLGVECLSLVGGGALVIPPQVDVRLEELSAAWRGGLERALEGRAP